MNQKNYQAIENRRQKETFSGQKPPSARKLSGPQYRVKAGPDAEISADSS